MARSTSTILSEISGTRRAAYDKSPTTLPTKLLRLVALLPLQDRSHQSAQSSPGVVERLPSFERRKSRFLPRAILHAVHVQRQNFFFAVAFNFFIESLAGFVAQPARRTISSTSTGTL